MTNTTGLMLVCYGEYSAVSGLSTRSGVQFDKVSDGELCGGSHVLTIESYGACYRSLGDEKIAKVVSEFKNTPFDFPELAVLIITDDDNEALNRVVNYA